MAETMATPTEVVHDFCRGTCIDLLEAMRDAKLTTVSITVSDVGGVPSMYWYGLRRGADVFSVSLYGDDCPTE